jgi:hypothetical protein
LAGKEHLAHDRETLRMKVRICADLEEGRRFWRKLWTQQNLFDLWEIRLCFQKFFERLPHFIVAEEQNRPVGFLPLSWIEEADSFGYFPGETWGDRTWLEQNRIPAAWLPVRQALWDAAPENTELRYLHQETATSLPGMSIDEIGYHFYPQRHHYDFDDYWMLFSRKSRKQIRRELEKFEAMGCQYHLNSWEDITWMFEANLKTYGTSSYFYDSRFMNGFDSMLSFLARHRMLRVTTIRIHGRRAAVDVGAIFRNRYTVLAGGTDPEFLGIAKMINLFHIKWGCTQHFERIDFLCGDFGWKKRFHLHPHPLYRKNKEALDTSAAVSDAEQRFVFGEV